MFEFIILNTSSRQVEVQTSQSANKLGKSLSSCMSAKAHPCLLVNGWCLQGIKVRYQVKY